MLGSLDQNDVAERRNHTLTDTIRSMICNFDLNSNLWSEAIKTTVYILNRVLSKEVPKTPFELWKWWKPSLRHTWVWGCPVEISIYNPHLRKLDLRAINGYFIGYSEKSKGYKFYCPLNSLTIVESKVAKFLENDNNNGSVQPWNIDLNGSEATEISLTTEGEGFILLPMARE